MPDLGNLFRSMRLQCQFCAWPLPEDMTMEAAQLHFQVNHDTDEVKLDLVTVCACGDVMALTESRPTGGGFKDYFGCEACGSTGHVVRTESGRSP